MTKGLVYSTQERIANLKQAVQNLLKDLISAKQYMIVLGMIASCLIIIPYLSSVNSKCKVVHEANSDPLLKTWSPVRMPLSFNILLCWNIIQDQNIIKERYVQQISFPVSVTTTDGSGIWGWGGLMNNFTGKAVGPRWRNYNNKYSGSEFLTVRHFLLLWRTRMCWYVPTTHQCASI